ncbi:uncharacterized protein DS421_1g11400 [Arachis hypogaea]|nr:uncharacterized protein DS421_1g11400 [Arachis hypogaea]
MSRGRYLFYAIRKGKDPGVYTDWDYCKHKVLGVTRGRHNDSKRTLLLLMGGLRITGGGGRLLNQQEKGLKEDIVDMADAPVFVEDMEKLLLRVCLFLCIGPPNFYRRESMMDDGESALGFVVVLPTPGLRSRLPQKALEGEVADLKQHVESFYQWLGLK